MRSTRKQSIPQRTEALALILALGGALTLALAGCRRPEPGQAGQTVRQVGSTTVLPLAQKWREAYNAEHPDIDIAISGGGSGTGIKALMAGTTEIANSSRAIKEQERQQAEQAGMDLVEHIVAHDGIAVIVHPSNPVTALSVQELSDLYTGEITEWEPLGAAGLGAIQLINRDSASGTYEAFKDLVVTLNGTDTGRDYSPEALNQTSNQAVLATVARTKTAIGYIGLGYLNDSVKALGVTSVGGDQPVLATSGNVLAGTYPISRKLYCYTNGQPSGPVKDYLDWIKGPGGQAVAEQLGFVPVPASG
jgi:phosphate transport system substrate-binding protein